VNLDAKLALSVPASQEAVTMARQAVRALVPVLPEERANDLALLASELVSNGIRHAQVRAENGITLELFLFSDMVRVEVRDRGEGFDPPPDPQPSEERASGWGLFLVDRLAERWGVESESSKVWFEVAR
jgi:anti-sigma regulatory factor (Ser/Thr protein kinase)